MSVEPSQIAAATAQHLEAQLGDGSGFQTPVAIERVSLSGEWPDTDLEVRMRLAERPTTTYVLRTRLSDWDFPRAGLPPPTAVEWAVWICESIVEAVEATPGLPAPDPGQAVVVVDLD